MKFEHYLERLHDSKEFKKFIGEHKKSFLCAGFFVFDFEEKRDIHQIDYYVRGKKKIATFMMDGGVELKMLDPLMKKSPEEIKGVPQMDLDTLKGIIEDEMKNHTITSKINKIIAVLQSLDKKLIWNLNCLTNQMGLIRAHVDDKTGDILKFEKANLIDFVRKVK